MLVYLDALLSSVNHNILISWCVEVAEVCARMVARCTARWFYRRRAHVEVCSEKCFVHIDIDIGLD